MMTDTPRKKDDHLPPFTGSLHDPVKVRVGKVVLPQGENSGYLVCYPTDEELDRRPGLPRDKSIMCSLNNWTQEYPVPVKGRRILLYGVYERDDKWRVDDEVGRATPVDFNAIYPVDDTSDQGPFPTNPYGDDLWSVEEDG